MGATRAISLRSPAISRSTPRGCRSRRAPRLPAAGAPEAPPDRRARRRGGPSGRRDRSGRERACPCDGRGGADDLRAPLRVASGGRIGVRDRVVAHAPVVRDGPRVLRDGARVLHDVPLVLHDVPHLSCTMCTCPARCATCLHDIAAVPTARSSSCRARVALGSCTVILVPCTMALGSCTVILGSCTAVLGSCTVISCRARWLSGPCGHPRAVHDGSRVLHGHPRAVHDGSRVLHGGILAPCTAWPRVLHGRPRPRPCTWLSGPARSSSCRAQWLSGPATPRALHESGLVSCATVLGCCTVVLGARSVFQCAGPALPLRMVHPSEQEGRRRREARRSARAPRGSCAGAGRVPTRGVAAGGERRE